MDTVKTVSNMLLNNIDKIHTTELGVLRIQKNLEITEDPVAYCIRKVLNYKSSIIREGKNYYIKTDHEIITINASSYTSISAHNIKKG